ncbi:MAG TPA: hypothetical protein VNK89_14125 [Thermoflexus sp.]|nr:hypothetical protein [Thermoflexus sp.]
MRPGGRRGLPLLLLFGKGEATLTLIAALVASGGPPSGPWLMGAWLLAEGGWPALRWLFLEAPWGPLPPSTLLGSPLLPYLQPGSPADRFLRTMRRLVDGISHRAREVPELLGVMATAFLALGVGIGLVGSIGGWLTLGAGIALALARRLERPGVREGVEGWTVGTLPWWLGLAGGMPSMLALLVGIPIGLAWMGFRIPQARWIAWPLWTIWAVAIGHGPGAYGVAFIGLLLGEERIGGSPRARGLLWVLALAITVWILRTQPIP